ncbi:hypothetical protein POMI540_1222 [Schizosaccharomyces pombe]
MDSANKNTKIFAEQLGNDFTISVDDEDMEMEYPLRSSTPTKVIDDQREILLQKASRISKLDEALCELNNESNGSIDLSIDSFIPSYDEFLHKKLLNEDTGHESKVSDQVKQVISTPMSTCFEQWFEGEEQSSTGNNQDLSYSSVNSLSPKRRGISLMSIDANKLSPKKTSPNSGYITSPLRHPILLSETEPGTPTKNDSPAYIGLPSQPNSITTLNNTNQKFQVPDNDKPPMSSLNELSASYKPIVFDSSQHKTQGTDNNDSFYHDDTNCIHLSRLEKIRELLTFVQLELKYYVEPLKKELQETKTLLAQKEEEISNLKDKLQNAGLS